MTSHTITAPKAPIFIGSVVVGGQTYDVAQHPEFVRFFFDLIRRLGGPNGLSNEELLVLVEAAQGSVMASGPDAQDAIRGVDELRNEVAATRSDVQALRGEIESLGAELIGLRAMSDLAPRVQRIEDRLS